MADSLFKPNLDFGTFLGPIKTPGDGIREKWVRKWFPQPEYSTPLEPGGYWGWVWVPDPEDDPSGSGGGGLGGFPGVEEKEPIGGGNSGGSRGWKFTNPPPPPKEDCPNWAVGSVSGGLVDPFCSAAERSLFRQAYGTLMNEWAPKLGFFQNPNLFECMRKKFCELTIDCRELGPLDRIGLSNDYGPTPIDDPDTWDKDHYQSITTAKWLRYPHSSITNFADKEKGLTAERNLTRSLALWLIDICSGSPVDGPIIVSWINGCFNIDAKWGFQRLMRLGGVFKFDKTDKVYLGTWTWWNPKTGETGMIGSDTTLDMPIGEGCRDYFKAF